MSNAHLWRRTREPLRGVPAPLPPSALLTNAGSLRKAFVKFQSMNAERREQYTNNIKTAYAVMR